MAGSPHQLFSGGSRWAPRLIELGRLAIGVTLIAVLIRSGSLDWRSLGNLLYSFPLGQTALGLLFGVLLLTSWRLCVLLQARGLELSMSASLRLTLIGAFFNTGLPGTMGGDLVRGWYALARNQGHRVEIATVLLLDRAIGVSALLLWPLLAAPMVQDTLAASPTLVLLIFGPGTVLIVCALGVAMFVRFSGDRVRLPPLLSRLPAAVALERSIGTLRIGRRDAGPLALALGISLAAQTASAVALWLLVRAAGSPSASPSVVLVVPLGFLVNALPLSPGGIGVGEVAFDRLFALAGVAGGAGALLSWRILTSALDLSGFFLYVRGVRIDVTRSP